MKHNELANMKQEIDKKLAPVIAKMTQYSVEYEELISPDRLEGDEYWDCLSYNLSDIEYPSSSILTDMLVVVNELDLNDCEDTLCSGNPYYLRQYYFCYNNFLVFNMLNISLRILYSEYFNNL